MRTADAGHATENTKDTSPDTPDTSVWRPFAADLVAGSSRRDITPPLGIRTANWGAEGRHELATGVHQPLTVTALALTDYSGRSDHSDHSGRSSHSSRSDHSDSTQYQYIVSVDLGWWRDSSDEESVRKPILVALRIDESQLLLHLVHTHSGPCTTRSQHLEPGGALVDSYLVRLTRTITTACLEARAAAQPCHITWGTGRCGLATVRDLPCGDRDVVGFNPHTPADDTLVVGRIADSRGHTVETIVNYACHPTTLAWQNPLLSPDFVGPARVLVETATSAPCVFLQGASGDLAPRDQYTGDIDVAERNGRVVGHGVLSTLEAMPRPGHMLRFGGVVESGASLGIWEQVPTEASTALSSQLIQVPVELQPALSPEELSDRWRHTGETPARERVERAIALRNGYVQDGEASHPVWLMEVGDAVIVAHPGEAYSIMQIELRRRHPDRCILVANCTNGPGFMYLPERSAYERVPYQVWQTLVDVGSLEAVIEATDAAISELGKPPGESTSLASESSLESELP